MTLRRWLLVGVVAILLFGAGYALRNAMKGTVPSAQDYPLLARRLFMEEPSDIRINFSPLRSQLNKYFTDNKLEGSLYFEYLPTGTSVRVNPDTRYRAASLIKLPVAMELYKSKEQGKLKLDQKVALKQEWLNDGYGSLYEKGAGYELTLKQAVEIMLKESDNTALRILVEANKDLDMKDRALGSLDIEQTTHEDGAIDIGTRSYSSFLKCLYFACYNTFEDSQEILDMLTKTPFNNRLVAGVEDKNVMVAHKIGVYNRQVQSDCGIIYIPRRNYVLCISMNGDDSAETNGRIAEISRMVYSFVKD